MNINVHLSFATECRPAFEFYAALLDGKIEALMPYAGSPVESSAPGGNPDLIMHAFMTVGGTSFMGADSGDRAEKMAGAHVSLNYKDPVEAKKIFDALAEGGEIQMAFEKTFWAAGFGMVRDRFGIQWMVNAGQ